MDFIKTLAALCLLMFGISVAGTLIVVSCFAGCWIVYAPIHYLYGIFFG